MYILCTIDDIQLFQLRLSATIVKCTIQYVIKYQHSLVRLQDDYKIIYSKISIILAISIKLFPLSYFNQCYMSHEAIPKR
jgi:hypothetical protein